MLYLKVLMCTQPLDIALIVLTITNSSNTKDVLMFLLGMPGRSVGRRFIGVLLGSIGKPLQGLEKRALASNYKSNNNNWLGLVHV